MKWQAYPRYKPSGVEWLGEVPEHWRTEPLKYSADFINGMAFKPETWSTTGIPIIRIENLNGGDDFNCCESDVPPKYHVDQGDLLFGWSGNRGTSFGPFLWGRKGLHYLNQHIFKLAALKHDRAWFYWCLKAVTRTIEDEAHGIIGMVHVTRGKLGAVQIPVIAPVEQRSIADFLDRETLMLDTLVAKKRTLIERLKEKRTALIARTVTRGLPPDAARAVGLDPYPKLKASGIDWLGDLPEHWAPKRLRFIATHITVGIVVEPSKYYEESGVPCLRSLNVQPNKLIDRDLVYISPESHRMLSKSMVKKGDLVAVRSGQPGTTAVIDDRFDGANCIDLIIARKPRDGNPTFISYFLNSLPAQAQFTGGSGGAIQQHFNIATAADLWLIEPPPSEQDAVAVFLDRETTRIDNMVAKIETAIDRLQEYRTALITAAVTGKIDVRAKTSKA